MNAEPGWRSAWVAVELTGGVGAAAEHGADPPVGGHGDQRHLLSPLAVCLGERRLHRLLRRALQLLIERGAHHEARLIRVGVQSALGEHPVGEVAGAGAGARRGHLRRRSLGRRGVRRPDRAGLDHAAQHHLGAGAREPEIARRRGATAP